MGYDYHQGCLFFSRQTLIYEQVTLHTTKRSKARRKSKCENGTTVMVLKGFLIYRYNNYM